MTWKQQTDISSNFYLDTFKKQHIKYTPQALLDTMKIVDFGSYLTNIWNESVELFSNNSDVLVYDYVDSTGSTIAYALGIVNDNTFHIRHFNFVDFNSIDKKIFSKFLKSCNYTAVTIRSRKGIDQYHNIIMSLGFLMMPPKSSTPETEAYQLYILTTDWS
jgi:hypothetical protein